MNDQPDEADQILQLVRQAGYDADSFRPGESLEEFLRRHGMDID